MRSKFKKSCLVIAASQVLLAAGQATGQFITTSWNSASDGSWHDGARWSSSPQFPTNGTPPGSSYDVVINAAGSPYKVLFGVGTTAPSATQVTVHSVTLSSPDATLDLRGGRLAAGTFDVQSGSLLLNGGTMSGTVVGNGPFVSSSGTLDAVSLATPLTLASSANVINGLTLNGVSVSGISSLARGTFFGTQTLSGVGTWDTNLSHSGGTLTFAPGIVVRRGLAGGTSVVNQGTILQENSVTTQIISVGSDPTGGLYNDGTIAASNAQLNIFGRVVNRSGIIRISNGGTLVLDNLISPQTSDLGIIQNQGGVIEFSGTWNNANDTIDVATLGGTVVFGSGAIVGGNIDTTGALDWRFEQFAFQGVTASGTLNAISRGPNNGAHIRVSNSLTLDNATINLGGQNSMVEATRDIGGELRGTGTIVFGGVNDENEVTNNQGNAGLIIGPGIVIRSGTRGGWVSSGIYGPNDQTPLINRGQIIADNGQTIRTTCINQGTFQAMNNGRLVVFQEASLAAGTLIASSNGTIEFGGTRTLPSLGSISNQGGAFEFSGTLQLNGSSINLDNTLGRTSLRDGRMVNGAVSGAGPVVLKAGSYVDGVTLNVGEIEVREGAVASFSSSSPVTTGRLIFRGGTATAYGTLSVGELRFEQPITGTNNADANRLFMAAASLQTGSESVIRTAGGSGRIQAVLVNRGTIVAEGAGRQILIAANGGSMSNSGTIEAIAGGRITLGSGSLGALWTNTGVFRVNEGFFDLGGTFTPASLGTFDRIGGTVSLTGSLGVGTIGFDLAAVKGPLELRETPTVRCDRPMVTP